MLAVLIVLLVGGVAAMITPPASAAQLSPTWPKPLPAWYADWADWYHGKGAYEGDARNRKTRPADAPREIPWWGWQRLAVLRGEPLTEYELPRGGRELLPDYRVVSFFGAPQHPRLGVLGIGSPDKAAAKLRRQIRPYRSAGRPMMPAFELIGVIALAGPGGDGKYRFRQSDRTIRRYLNAARRAGGLLILDIQPGRAPFLGEVKRFEKFLRQPDVGLALDPEWSMRPSQIPGQVIGSTTAEVVNSVSAYLARLVREYDLPEKLLVVHQFTDGMIRNKRRLKHRKGVAFVLNADGFGEQAAKISKYEFLTSRTAGLGFHRGFKLFYEEDTNLMRPSQVLGLDPEPDLVIYE